MEILDNACIFNITGYFMMDFVFDVNIDRHYKLFALILFISEIDDLEHISFLSKEFYFDIFISNFSTSAKELLGRVGVGWGL